MTQKALKLALEVLENGDVPTSENVGKNLDAITAIKQALAQKQEPVAVYGYCPECGAKGVMRERRPNGNDKCANGHTYPSSASTPPQRTWVGLTWEEIDECFKITPDQYLPAQIYKRIEAKLKEKNT